MKNNTSSELLSRNEDVSNFVIGSFGDFRLLKTGALLFKKLVHTMSSHIRKLSPDRAHQVAFGRFLANEKCTVSEIEATLSQQTNEACLGKKHVLSVQDTVEINYASQPKKKQAFGVNRNKNKINLEGIPARPVRGFIGHPSLIVDAENNDILGLSSVQAWSREDEMDEPKQANRPIEKKESYKWITAATMTKDRIKNVEMITIIGDRESDIYELFDRIPDERTHLLIRSNHNRKLNHGKTLDETMTASPIQDSYEIELPGITGRRKKRKATVEVKFTSVEIIVPSNIKSTISKKSISLTCIEVIETSTNGTESPIHWRLLTTHKVGSVSDAKKIITWYSWRWNIEQVFRILKTRGLNINESEISRPDSLLNLFVLSIAAAVKVLCLVNARNGATSRPASDLFSDDELIVLSLVLIKVSGKTKKQQNPYLENSLSWTSWIIARLGGWMGYRSERPPGPITMFNGLNKFYSYVEGWRLGQKDVCTR